MASAFLTLSVLTSGSEIEAAQRLRYRVWSLEGVDISESEKNIIADPHDDHAMHWGVYDGHTLVAAARLCIHNLQAETPDAEMFTGVELPCPVASFNRLVVLKSHRGLHIGRQLDDIRMKQARAIGARSIIITPADNEKRRHSLEKRGFYFIPNVSGHPVWSQTLPIRACYLIVDDREHSDAG